MTFENRRAFSHLFSERNFNVVKYYVIQNSEQWNDA